MRNSIAKKCALSLAVLALCSLTACAKKGPSGSYESEVELLGQRWSVTYTFKGNKVEAESKLEFLGSVTTQNASGTVELTEKEDGSMEITLDFEPENGIFQDETLTYAEGENHIELGGVTYTKVAK